MCIQLRSLYNVFSLLVIYSFDIMMKFSFIRVLYNKYFVMYINILEYLYLCKILRINEIVLAVS